MPVFEITTPDGATFEVEGPDEQGALAAVKKMAGTSPAPQKRLEDVPDMLDPNGRDYSRRHGGSLVTGLVDAFGEAFTTPGKVARGEIQMQDPMTGHVSDQGIEAAFGMGAALTPSAPAARALGGLAKAAPTGRAILPDAPPTPAAPAMQTLTREELQQASRQAYKAADEAEVIIKPQAVQRLSAEIKNDLAEFGFKPRLAPKVGAFLDDLDKAASGTQPHTLKSLDLLRREAQLMGKSLEPAEREIARQVVKKIDKHLDGLEAPDILPGGNVTKGVMALKQARELWRSNKKSEVLEEAVERAELRAANQGSGGNIDNDIRQQLRRIVESRSLSRSFSPHEISIMKQIIRGSKSQNIARLIGKLSPEGNGLMMALQGGMGYATGGQTLPVALVGMAAKRYADKVTPKRVKKLDEMVRTIPVNRSGS
jgi:hypothetical protein